MNSLIRRVALVILICFFSVSNAYAHKTSVTYLELTYKQLAQGLWSLQLMLPLEELDLKFGLDADGNSLLNIRELDQKIPTIVSYATDRVSLSTAHGSGHADCQQSVVNHTIDQHTDSQESAVFLSLRLQFKCLKNPTSLRIRYDLFGEFDAAHRAILSFTDTRQVLVPGEAQTLTLVGDQVTAGSDSAASSASSLPGYIGAGFHHILIGWDHLAFLIALLIPLMAGPAGFTRHQVKSLLITVSVFTLGHSLSLAAATLGWLTVPTRLVEVIIAASIVIAAGVCLLRREFRFGPALAGGFGLVHGFGFANVLELGGASGSDLWFGLIGFNLGVEAGQLLFVALALPALAAVAWFSVSRPLVTKGLPVALMLAGAGWFAERLTSINLIPG